ncbi:MAG: hypothetical protein NC903_02975, partial [Candidatus Omnitrophica bacterium]|nr:hypothetical protein [Candidatus Omnitrophota bacterium]
SSLEEENLSLKQENRQLIESIDKLTIEKGSLEKKLNSIEELKKILKELKRKIYLENLRIKREKELIFEGNRGYIIKDGKPTLRAKVKIEVIPVE